MPPRASEHSGGESSVATADCGRRGTEPATTLDEALAENRRLQQELRLRDSALDATNTGILIIDMQSKGRPIVYANRAAAERTGYPHHELIGLPSARLSPRERNDDRVYRVREAMRAGEALRIELIAAKKDGGEYWAGIALTPIRDANDRVTHYVSTSADITMRRRSELQSKRDRERLAAVVESALEGVIAVNSAFQITLFNGAAEKIFGRSAAEMTGQPIDSLMPERFRAENREYVNRFVASGESNRRMGTLGQLTGLRANGEEFAIEASISRVSGDEDIALTIMLRDISEQIRAQAERTQLESQLRLAQKLEAVGQLAAGIAHEINTPIQYIGDSVQFLQTARQDGIALLQAYRDGVAALEHGASLDEIKATLRAAEKTGDVEFYEAEVPKAFERTVQGIERVANIVRAMKEFSHPDPVEHREADINHALETTLVVSRNEYKYVATVEKHLQELPLVICNIGELNQVFLNIIVNAAHAIDEKKHDVANGRILVTSEPDGEFVKIVIADNGCGIPKSNLEKIFDPFFTTKEVGKGTGQGLAIARSIIVTKHRGTIDIDSEVGVGTKFTIRIPIAGRGESEAVL